MTDRTRSSAGYRLRSAPDVATASLDVENETLIQTALSGLIRNKTVLVIAHRMKTVAGANKIVVLEDGVVAEQGSPDELYQKNGIYTHGRSSDQQSELEIFMIASPSGYAKTQSRGVQFLWRNHISDNTA